MIGFVEWMVKFIRHFSTLLGYIHVQDRTNRPGQEDQLNHAAVEEFIAQLAEEEKMLILLQRELYDGSWDDMLVDLQNRLNGRPYIFKLANRIKDDIARIEKLKTFEDQHNLKLADYVKPPA